MIQATFADVLGARTYPGRGLALVQMGSQRVIVYFLTGRSEASRCRHLVIEKDGGVAVVGEPEASSDSLRHYRAIRRDRGLIVAGNGEHVDAVFAGLRRGSSAGAILDGISAEPDPPIWTPRIWMAVSPESPILIGSARRRGGLEDVRTLWSLTGLRPRDGVVLTTYDGSRSEVNVCAGIDEVKSSSADPESLLVEVWEALDPQLRVAAVAIAADDSQLFPPVILSRT